MLLILVQMYIYYILLIALYHYYLLLEIYLY